jgi:hypothetical protein
MGIGAIWNGGLRRSCNCGFFFVGHGLGMGVCRFVCFGLDIPSYSRWTWVCFIGALLARYWVRCTVYEPAIQHSFQEMCDIMGSEILCLKSRSFDWLKWPWDKLHRSSSAMLQTPGVRVKPHFTQVAHAAFNAERTAKTTSRLYEISLLSSCKNDMN